MQIVVESETLMYAVIVLSRKTSDECQLELDVLEKYLNQGWKIISSSGHYADIHLIMQRAKEEKTD